MVEPIYKERDAARVQHAWDQRAMQFKAHADMSEHRDEMVMFLESNPEIANKENAIELAYNYAKGVKVSGSKES